MVTKLGYNFERSPILFDWSGFHGQLEVYAGKELVAVGEYDHTGVSPLIATRYGILTHYVRIDDNGSRKTRALPNDHVLSGDRIELKMRLKVSLGDD